ncbi:uncharacterized protein METZ01_LOCUS119020 [marine metagenome]|uniref:Uncharacterized protein n=1 Tax=marine metagenome TaxID=408172 RepID=A0A381XN10_9ZZZZ|tara:strand:- start:2741 stop:3694 length:954 start_codon:yes stop_codon:yes gene_type:complete
MTSNTSVIKYKNFDLANITYSDVKQTKMGGYNIYLQYKTPGMSNGHNIYVQTPKMFCPFGASSYKKIDSNELPRYNLNLSFKKTEQDLLNFQEKISNLDDMVLEKVLNDPKLLSLLNIKGKKVSKEGLRFLQVPTVKLPKDDTKDYPANLSVKIPTKYDTGAFITEFYDSKTRERMEVDHDNIESLVPKKVEVKCLLRFASIWFVGGKFGIALRGEQVVVYPSKSLVGFAFIDDSDDEDEQVAEVSEQLKGVVLSDTEDEDEEVDEEVEEVVSEDEEVEEDAPVLSEDSDEVEEVVEEAKPKRRGRKKTTTSRKRKN